MINHNSNNNYIININVTNIKSSFLVGTLTSGVTSALKTKSIITVSVIVCVIITIS